MKRLLLVLALLLVLGAVVSPTMAARETFQDWKNHSLIAMPDMSYQRPYMLNTTTGVVFWGMRFVEYHAREQYGSVSDYCAADTRQESYFRLYDSSRIFMYGDTFNCNTDLTTGDPGRIEIKIDGGTPSVYCNGVFKTAWATKAYNPSYCDFTGWTGYADYSNYVFGETDHHVVRAMPTNWTIIQDLIDPKFSLSVPTPSALVTVVCPLALLIIVTLLSGTPVLS